MRIEPETIGGHTLTGVWSSWHEFEGSCSTKPVHVWLGLEGLGTLRLHTLNGLVISQDDVYKPYDMGEYGRVRVEESGPTALLEQVGERLEGVSRLDQSPPWASVGVVLRFPHGLVGVADLGDELVVGRWPGEEWARRNVSIAAAD